MDRKEFCDLLVKTRKESGVKMKSICEQLNAMPTSIYNIERGSTNFNISSAIKYITIIKSTIVVKNKVIRCYDDVVRYICISRKNKYSQRELADLIGISYVHLANIESKKTIVGVDIFLKIVEIFGDELQLRLPPNSHKEQLELQPLPPIRVTSSVLHNSIFEINPSHSTIVYIKQFFKDIIETNGWYKRDPQMYSQKATYIKNKFYQNKLGIEEINTILNNLGYIPDIKIISPDGGTYFSDYATAYEILSKIYNINKTLGIDSLEAHKIKDGNEKRLRIDVILQFLIKIGCDIDIKWELPELVEI